MGACCWEGRDADLLVDPRAARPKKKSVRK
jgi:hypothetical protein